MLYPPKLTDTVTVGEQPSGLSFNAAGDLALDTNRADRSISVLSVRGTDVKVIDTRHGKPEIFNTDQGSQFTGAAFTGVLIKSGIAISKDAKVCPKIAT